MLRIFCLNSLCNHSFCFILFFFDLIYPILCFDHIKSSWIKNYVTSVTTSFLSSEYSSYVWGENPSNQGKKIHEACKRLLYFKHRQEEIRYGKLVLLISTCLCHPASAVTSLALICRPLPISSSAPSNSSSALENSTNTSLFVCWVHFINMIVSEFHLGIDIVKCRFQKLTWVNLWRWCDNPWER